MRTDERAGQAAKFELECIEDELRQDESRHPDGVSIPLRPEQRLDLVSKAKLLRRVCGIT